MEGYRCIDRHDAFPWLRVEDRRTALLAQAVVAAAHYGVVRRPLVTSHLLYFVDGVLEAVILFEDEVAMTSRSTSSLKLPTAAQKETQPAMSAAADA